MLTLYGRKPVLEALQDPSVTPFRLHLATSNKPVTLLDDILLLAESKGAEVRYHTRDALSRISKNSKQDQGVAIDLQCPGFQQADDFLAAPPKAHFELLALDGITNPQNVGMIIRSATAGAIDGIILPEKGCAPIDPLVIKASAGTVFKANILRCSSLVKTLKQFRQHGTHVYGLSSHADTTLANLTSHSANIYVLGNETKGVSKEVSELCNKHIAIPMNNNVESLNVAVTAALIAFRTVIR
ncbi:TrmH family RNA methyltransferase [Marinibactrum halimedae]|nr:RNA methyltransferase [Marinibactrum halimedae]MCD9461151.1 RNA methyltransferase [Marinibactrum halimedae]